MRENECMQLAIGFGFASHWLRKWREFCQPITEQSKAKPKQMQIIITFDTQLKTTLNVTNINIIVTEFNSFFVSLLDHR